MSEFTFTFNLDQQDFTYLLTYSWIAASCYTAVKCQAAS